MPSAVDLGVILSLAIFAVGIGSVFLRDWLNRRRMNDQAQQAGYVGVSEFSTDMEGELTYTRKQLALAQERIAELQRHIRELKRLLAYYEGR